MTRTSKAAATLAAVAALTALAPAATANTRGLLPPGYDHTNACRLANDPATARSVLVRRVGGVKWRAVMGPDLTARRERIIERDASGELEAAWCVVASPSANELRPGLR